MFKKILIANRGEIALRVIRACREMGIASVAVFSEADRNSHYLKLADEKICIGPARSTNSYLYVPNIISAAEITGADALHPGYGFLAENANFVEVCESHGIHFIGPNRDSIEKMGNKLLARRIMHEAGIKVIPGSLEPVDNLKKAEEIAGKIGYPVILKASAGGGGKGMRIVESKEQLAEKLEIVQSEAEASFGDRSIYLEKYIESGRHIEFQILADTAGNVVHLGERECSIQRKHQKLIEEAPSPIIDAATRKKMGEVACRAAKSINYTNAGTIEFLVDDKGDFYFMEMNTRLQVEHPVTEMVTDIDLVKQQILIACGNKLSFTQDDVKIHGHAIECRINAENYEKNFQPCTGTVEIFIPPGGPGVRLDSHVYPGYSICPYYDSMIGKLIVWDDSREKAIERMKRSLDEFEIRGVTTTIPLHKVILRNEKFRAGDFSTALLSEIMSNR